MAEVLHVRQDFRFKISKFAADRRFLPGAFAVSPGNMDEPAFSGRSVDIELGGQEVITIDLDNLDPNPEDVLDLLKDGQCRIWVWTKLAGEYWRRGYLEAAERIALAAIECASAPLLEGPLLTVFTSQHSKPTAQQHRYPRCILFWRTSKSLTRGRHPKSYCQMPVCTSILSDPQLIHIGYHNRAGYYDEGETKGRVLSGGCPVFEFRRKSGHGIW
jgi:hypothetical protein